MSSLPEPLSFAAAAGLVAAIVAYSVLAGSSSDSIHATRARIRRMLPNTLYGWRVHAVGDRDKHTQWQALRSVFADHGYTLWETSSTFTLETPGEGYDAAQNGYEYATPFRDVNKACGMIDLYGFMLLNHSCYAATSTDGQSVVLRVLKIGEEGQQHLNLLRYLARAPPALFSNNHTLPLLREIRFEDITFGVFPRVGQGMTDAYRFWAKNSVGDLIEMILQMLEALVFIHDRRIAHRDAFKDNFLIQWHPESITAGFIGVSRPRVYLHDFESAVRFPVDCPVEEQVVVGVPRGSWDTYGRPCPPEMASGSSYNPYKADIWQLGTSLSDMKTTIPEVDELLDAMIEPDADRRMTALELLTRLRDIFQSTPVKSFNIPPTLIAPDTTSCEESHPVGSADK
ncbi:kinase-like domain-containing protein [Fomes fomentarius]|nr:kinase-like domain-containing protein [Fomes fomentarius]